MLSLHVTNNNFSVSKRRFDCEGLRQLQTYKEKLHNILTTKNTKHV